MSIACRLFCLNLLCLSVLLCGCSSRPAVFSELAVPAPYEPLIVRSGPFSLHGLIKTGASDVVRVYFEGDGYAYVRGRPTSDPTPHDPVTRMLALEDPAENVAYIVRPCQYEKDVACGDRRFWTTDRYGEEVVSAMDAAVSRMKLLSGARRVELVGFSGGGTIALLVAARRDDVVQIMTVASNVAVRYWLELHGFSRLDGSLDPVDYGAELSGVPRIHFVGGEDTLVPPSVAHAFEATMQDGSGRIVIVPDQGHGCCWPQVWRTLLQDEAWSE